MTRRTSIVVYKTIEKNGLLSKMRWRVYDCLFHHGPMTRSELDNFLKAPGEVNPSYHKRLSELLDLGVVYEVKTRPCRVTGRVVIEWDVTPELPTNASKPSRVSQPNKEVLKQAMKDFSDLHKLAKQHGHSFSKELLQTIAWVGYKAGTFKP